MSVVRWLPGICFATLFFFLGYGLALDPHILSTPKIGKTMPVFDLPALLAPPGHRFTSDIFLGHKSILVIWASWCEACREEQAFLMHIAQQKNVRVYGLNYKDDPLAAKQWLVEWGNPFQAIGMDRHGKLALDLGVYGTPETYLINEQGTIQHRFAGRLTPAIWRREFLPYL